MSIDIVKFIIMFVIVLPLVNLINLLGSIFFIKLLKWELIYASLGKGAKIYQVGKIRVNKFFFYDRFYRYKAKPAENFSRFWIWVSLGGIIFNIISILLIYMFVKAGIIKYTLTVADIIWLLILRIALDIVPYKRNGYYSEGMKIYRFIKYRSVGEYADYDTLLKELDLKIRYHEERGMVTADLAATFSGKGQILNRLKRFEESIIYFDRAIELNPDFANAYNNKGNSLLSLSKYEEALDCYTMAVSLAPSNGMYFYNIACAYSLLNNVNEALLYLKKSIELDKGSKVKAKKDADFDNIRENIQFKEIIFS